MTQIIKMIDAAMVEMASITPPLRRSECEQLIRAALSVMVSQEPIGEAVSEAQPAGPEDMAIYKSIADGYLKAVDHMPDAGKMVQPLGWYCVDKAGGAILCTNEDEANDVAAMRFVHDPKSAPYRAMQLCEYAQASEPQDADPNAPWLTKAHMLCTDHGVPQGNIEWRLEVLRGVFKNPQASEPAWMPIETAPTSGLVLLAVVDTAGERRAFCAEASFSDGKMHWQVTTGWAGFTRLHSAWKVIGWQPLPAAPEAT
jgi:hypothetical protein